uniref:Golgi SNAP receptor complex member 2 n=1 Tax=Plectus sambesii TaxID=2011161 RepID=A0A914W7P8_9BILA
METLYQETNSLLQQIHFSLATLERSGNASQANQLEQSIQEQLHVISSNCERLDLLVGKEVPAKRRNAKYRVDQLKYDCLNLNSALSNIQQKLVLRFRETAEREELLSRRFTANDVTSVEMNDAELVHNDRLNTANRNVDDLIDHGQSVMDSLRSQKMSLKGVRRKMLDVAQQLGVSTTVLRMIERRVGEDKIIFAIGALLTLTVMFLFYRYYKG